MNCFTWDDFKIRIEAFSRGSSLFSSLAVACSTIDGAVDDQRGSPVSRRRPAHMQANTRKGCLPISKLSVRLEKIAMHVLQERVSMHALSV